MNRITVAELEWLLERGAVDLVDVRPEEDFREVHLYGARSVPLAGLDPRSFGADRGRNESLPLCLMCNRTLRASLAAGMIAGAGVANPRVLAGGLQAWQKQGLPVVEHTPSPTFSRLLVLVADHLRSAIALLGQRLRLRRA